MKSGDVDCAPAVFPRSEFTSVFRTWFSISMSVREVRADLVDAAAMLRMRRSVVVVHVFLSLRLRLEVLPGTARRVYKLPPRCMIVMITDARDHSPGYMTCAALFGQLCKDARLGSRC